MVKPFDTLDPKTGASVVIPGMGQDKWTLRLDPIDIHWTGRPAIDILVMEHEEDRDSVMLDRAGVEALHRELGEWLDLTKGDPA